LHFLVVTKPATWNVTSHATTQEVRKALGNLQGLSPLVKERKRKNLKGRRWKYSVFCAQWSSLL